MADIQLIIGADENLSLSELQGGISNIVGKLNSSPPKIKIDLDKKAAEEQISRLRNQIKELGTEASKVKFGANLSSSLNSVNKNIATLSKSIADIGKNTGLSNISEGFERLVPVIENLKGELKSLQGAISNFQGVNINLGMTGDAFSRNAAYGQSARQSISELRSQAQQIEQYLAEYYKMSDRAAAAMRTISGTNALQGKDIFSILGNANNPKLSLSAQMDSLREYIALLERASKAKGINLTPVTQQFSATADKIIEGTRKVQTGEQQLEASTEKLKSVFGSGVNASALTEQLTQIHTAIISVNEAIASLNTEGNPFASLQGSITQIVTSLEQLNASVTNISTILNNGSVSTGEMASQLSNEATQAQNAASANSQNADAISELLQVVRQYIADIQAEREADRESAKAKEEAAAKAREAAKQKREAARAEKEAAKETANAQKEEENAKKASASETQRQTRIINSYHSMLLRVERALSNCTAAEHSKNQSSRVAYDAMQSSRDIMKQTMQGLDGSVNSYNRLDAAIKQCGTTIKASEATIRANGDATKSFKDRMSGLASKFGAWLSVSQVIMYAYRSVKKMVSASIELDSAMAQMQIVTKASNEEMRRFGDEAAQVAQKTATSITDVISSSTTYARLGYSMDESKQLAEYTAMLQKVGDIDVDDAQNAVTAIIKAYDKGTDEIENVMDKLVSTGNAFPISVSEIAEGMNNASSTLAAAGNNFEQSVALLTASNTTIQNAAKSSTGLRTIAARIRKTKTELDDLGEAMTDADYDALVSGLTKAGVSLKDTNGEFRSTYDIMKDIASIWDKLSSMEQAGLATALSGTRQQAVFYSLIKNFKEASGAIDSMSNSTGELNKSYDIYLDTTEAKIERFKAKFQELGSDLLSSDLLGGIVDGAHTILNILDGITKSLGGIPTLIGAIAAALSGVKNIGRVRMFTLKMNMPIVTIVLFGYEQFRCYG